MESSLPVFHSKDESVKQQDQLNALWQKIEKHEIRNQKAELKIDALYAEYETLVLPHDKEMGKATCAWVKHLLSLLATKKSITKSAREQLLQYIEMELEELNSLSFFCDAEVLNALWEEFYQQHDQLYHKEKQQALDAACDQFELMAQSMFSQEVTIPRDELRQALESGDPSKVEALLASLKPENLTEDFSAADDDIEWRDFEFNYYYSDEDDAPNITEMFRGTQLNKMYKRIANVIHPDKEIDLAKKEEKHLLMQQLANAKKNNDVMTLIRMYSKYVPDADYSLDKETLARIEHLLAMRVRELNQEHRDLFNRQGLKSFIWQSFSATSKKKVRENMQAQITLAKKTAAKMNQNIDTINTPAKLKDFLKQFRFAASNFL